MYYRCLAQADDLAKAPASNQFGPAGIDPLDMHATIGLRARADPVYMETPAMWEPFR